MAMLEGLRVVKCTLGVAHVEYTKVRIMHIMLNQILRYTTPTLSFVASPGRRREYVSETTAVTQLAFAPGCST